jgi:thymidylate kinase
MVTTVSFSGMDGAGKSSQISELEAWLLQAGIRVQTVTFWDDIVVFRGLRESMSHRIFKGDKGIGSPENPLIRRDKNVQAWPINCLRFLLYAADAASLALQVFRLRRSGSEFIIFDRYIYDELANLRLSHKIARIFVRSLLRFVPRPDYAFVIDAEPKAAFARKPEYPLEFLHRNREAYRALAAISGTITILDPDSIPAIQKKIRQQVLRENRTQESSGVPVSQ